MLAGFNEKVTRLENTRFFQRYREEPPEIIMKFDRLDQVETGPIRHHGGASVDAPVATFTLSGYVRAWIEDFDQDGIDAFVLTYRLLTQDNDRYSVRRLAQLYDQPWMDPVARQHLVEHATTKAVPAVRLAEERAVMLAAPALKAPPPIAQRVALPVESLQHPLSVYDELLEVMA